MNTKGLQNGYGEGNQKTEQPSLICHSSEDARIFLERYLACEREIRMKQEKAREIRSMAEKTTQTLSFVPTGNQTQDRVGDAAAKLADLAVELDSSALRLQRVLWEVESAIQQVPNACFRDLLRLRYICGKKWEQIALELNYSWRQIIRLHNAALSAVQDVIECHTQPAV